MSVKASFNVNMIVFFKLFTLLSIPLLPNFSVAAQQCGRRPVSHLPLIYGGTDSREGEWPWHSAVYVFETIDRTPSYQCGGSLVSSNFVLTAAHCTTQYFIPIPADRCVVRFGITILDTVGSHSKYHKVQKIIRHEKYNPTNYHYDIALLKMADQVVFSDYIQPVCLPTKSATTSFRFGNVVGWGIGDNNQLQQVLQKATLGFVDAFKCLSSNSVVYSTLLAKDYSNFCAGNANETNVCNGDSGGGMFVYNQQDRRWYIVGVVSAGTRTSSTAEARRCNTTQHVMFGNVTHFNDWIVSKQNERTTNLLDLADCAVDDHDLSVPEEEKPVFLQYPWVTIQELSGPNGTEIPTVCSGVLIHPQFVLSIGHCVYKSCDKAKLTSVRLGEFDLSSDPDKDQFGFEISTQSVHVAKVIHHPEFSITGYRHNIALIKLSQSVDSEKLNIKPICLPKTRSNFVGKMSVVGWKRTGNEVLQRGITQQQNISSCKKVYSSIKVDLDPEESFLCVGSSAGNADDCYSFKSGSSLHYLDTEDGENRYYLRGLYAFGSSPCGLKLPNVFVDVHHYLYWIKQVVQINT